MIKTQNTLTYSNLHSPTRMTPQHRYHLGKPPPKMSLP